MLAKLKKLLASETTAEIRAALEAVDLNGLRAGLAAAEQKRSDLLLTGDDRQIVAAEADISAARIALDRAQAATTALDQKLAASLAKDADDAFLREYSAAEKTCDAVRKEITISLPKLVGEIDRILDVVRQSARARSEIYRKRAEAGESDTAAGRAVDIPSPLKALDEVNLPGWCGALVSHADHA